MIDIVYGFRWSKRKDILHQRRMSLGYGDILPSQTNFITIIDEEIKPDTGEMLWATWVWDSGQLITLIPKFIRRWFVKNK